MKWFMTFIVLFLGACAHNPNTREENTQVATTVETQPDASVQVVTETAQPDAGANSADSGAKSAGFSWPTEGQRLSSVQAAHDAIELAGHQTAVIVLMADWCPACRSTIGFWDGRTSPVALYVVDQMKLVEHNPGEAIEIHESGVQSIPACYTVVQGQQTMVAIGLTSCTEDVLELE